MYYLLRIAALAATMLLSACVTIPSGPSVTSLPGSGRSFDQFRADDNDCRQYATNAIGGTSPSQAQADSAVLSGVTGAAIGAAAGAAMDGSHGAGVGAGVGLLFGALAGSAASASSGYSVQQRYDTAYLQCMYAKGHQVPMAAPARSVTPRYRNYPPAAGVYYPPPPPPGYESAQAAPPPPPGVPSPPRAPSAGSDRLFIYPRNGQSEAQTAEDRNDCGRWATEQTGYDASRSTRADPSRSEYRRAISACLDGRGYTVR